MKLMRNSSSSIGSAGMTSHPTEVGIVGLGLLGSALAGRLAARGFRVAGYDLRAERREAMAALGTIAVVATAAGVLSRCELVLLSLPTHHEVRGVLTENVDQLRGGQIIVDTTTGDPASSVVMARELAARNVAYLDGTISGNSDQARAGDVVWMIGGDRAALDRCAGVLRELGREVFHTGPPGSGAKMKLVTNLVLGLNRAALAEGLAFAEVLGLDPAEALRVLRAGAAYSRIMDTKGEKMVSGDFAPQAKLSQHLKDVRLIRAAGAEQGMDLPLSATHEAILEHALALGLGELDNSALIEALRRRSGTP
jgi:3-hydroxyisobutyrate dehydrogenase-like beta-hydroxyacid dehydrogenase